MSLETVSLVQMQCCKKRATHVFYIAIQCHWRKAATASSFVRGGGCNDHNSVLRRYQ